MKNTKEKCICEEITCIKDCMRKHTHKEFWCENCHPERYLPTQVGKEEGKKEIKFCGHYSENFELCKICNSTPQDNEWEETLRDIVYKYWKNDDEVGLYETLEKALRKTREKSYKEGQENNLAKLIEECGENVYLKIEKDYCWAFNFEFWKKEENGQGGSGSTPEEAIRNLLDSLKKK